MRVVLEITTGPSAGRRIPLQAGEIARFGSSDLADVCFPGDIQMAGVHFELGRDGDRCYIRDLEQDGQTFLNDEVVTEADFADGDTIVAGQTTLVPRIEGQVVVDAAPESGALESEPDDSGAPTAAELCTMTELEEESLQLFRPQHSPEQFVLVLTEARQFADAIRILSLHLPKPQSVFWAFHCVREFYPLPMDTEENAALDATMDWLTEPEESNRRTAMDAANASEFRSAASWVALAAFWSGGSLAPADLPEVPPAPALCAQGVTAALLMTATSGDPMSSQERFEQILRAGREILSGKLAIPQPEPAA